MAFTATLNLVNEAHITLAGELDRLSAGTFQGQVEAAAKAKVNRLVLFAADLAYMASAGLRVLLFAKQKMGTAVDIYFVAPNKDVLDTLEKTGLAGNKETGEKGSLIIVNKYPLETLKKNDLAGNKETGKTEV